MPRLGLRSPSRSVKAHFGSVSIFPRQCGLAFTASRQNLLRVSHCPAYLSKDEIKATKRAIKSSHKSDKRLKACVWSREEVAKHRTAESCWLVVKGKVYDVTPWLPRHPAGVAAILRHAGGEDCAIDLAMHSKHARSLWKQFYIGRVEKT